MLQWYSLWLLSMSTSINEIGFCTAIYSLREGTFKNNKYISNATLLRLKHVLDFLSSWNLFSIIGQKKYLKKPFCFRISDFEWIQFWIWNTFIVLARDAFSLFKLSGVTKYLIFYAWQIPWSFTLTYKHIKWKKEALFDVLKLQI